MTPQGFPTKENSNYFRYMGVCCPRRVGVHVGHSDVGQQSSWVSFGSGAEGNKDTACIYMLHGLALRLREEG